MNEPESKSPATESTTGTPASSSSSPTNPPETGPTPETSEVERQLTNLKLAMLVLTCIFGLFMYQQRRYEVQDRKINSQAVGELSRGFQQRLPALSAFVQKLGEYSKTHPDFAPIAAKYGLTNLPPRSATSAPPTQPIATPPAKQ